MKPFMTPTLGYRVSRSTSKSSSSSTVVWILWRPSMMENSGTGWKPAAAGSWIFYIKFGNVTQGVTAFYIIRYDFFSCIVGIIPPDSDRVHLYQNLGLTAITALN